MAHTDEDLIGIPFPNHSNDVLCSLNEQRRDGLLCDVILVVRDQEYRTHRSVLAACSQYFKKLFTVATGSSQDSNQHAIYELDFVAPESLTAILEFAYTSTLTVTASNVKEILSAARLLEIPCIINVCLEIMDTGGGGERGGGEGPLEGEEFEGDDEDEEDEEDEEEMEEEVDSKDGEFEDNNSEKSTQGAENQEEPKVWEDGRTDSPPCSSQQGAPNPDRDGQETQRRQSDTPEAQKPRGQEGLEGRALKDFSIESLLQEGLYPKVPGLERGARFSPLLPGFYPPIWAAEFPGYSQILEPRHPSHPFPNASLENGPLDLAVKKEIIKEELKDEPSNPVLHRDFLKDFMSPGLGITSDPTLGTIKEGADLRSYLSFLSASHLGTLFPPWQLEEERKMKPKASQQCPICNKVIQGAGKLPRHMRTHTGEKPYMCTICEVRFTRQDKLKIHMRKHTGERPYICLHCNSKFVHNYDLKNHLRIHTGVRPYQCEHCYKSFTRSDHLHRHIKRQSCRVSRPRRGRKPSAWRSTNFLFPPDPNALQADRTMRLPATGGTPLLAKQQSTGGKMLEDAGGDSRETDRKLISEDANRKRGVFAFTVAREDILPHPPFYSATSDPWAMRLERAPPIPEAAK
uniref:Zinc finger and BTB domain containing 7C n=1 Tax=Cyprinus carpio TaxID=7962 RepID=A0A8C1ZKK1_CYPCA